VDEGALKAAVGRGYFVTAAVLTEPPNALMSFTELAAARGLSPTARVLGQSLRPATPEEANTFAIDVQELVFELERLRFLDDVPVAVDRTRIPRSVAPTLETLDFTDASIYAELSASGAAPVRAHAVVSAASADPARATLLDIPVGSPLIVCTTLSHDEGGRTVEIGEITYRADRYQFRATLTRRSQLPRNTTTASPGG
jgi:DNA-binding GntR family transcriptional regulator